MSVTVTINKRSIPHNDTTLVRYYGAKKSRGTTSLDLLAQRISGMCTVTEHDVRAVLAAFQRQIIDTLRNGDGVAMGDLGTIYVRCHARLVPTPEECTTDTVKSIYVAFKPSAKIANATRKHMLSFKVERPKSSTETNPSTNS